MHVTGWTPLANLRRTEALIASALAELESRMTDNQVASISQPPTQAVAPKQAAVPNFYQIAGQTAIVPKHIWSAFKDPASQVVKP